MLHIKRIILKGCPNNRMERLHKILKKGETGLISNDVHCITKNHDIHRHMYIYIYIKI